MHSYRISFYFNNAAHRVTVSANTFEEAYAKVAAQYTAGSLEWSTASRIA